MLNRELLELSKKLKRRHEQTPDIVEYTFEKARRRLLELKIQYMILMDEVQYNILMNEECVKDLLIWVADFFKNKEFRKLIQMTEVTEDVIKQSRQKSESLPGSVKIYARFHCREWSERNRLLRALIKDFNSKVEFFLPQAIMLGNPKNSSMN